MQDADDARRCDAGVNGVKAKAFEFLRNKGGRLDLLVAQFGIGMQMPAPFGNLVNQARDQIGLTHNFFRHFGEIVRLTRGPDCARAIIGKREPC